MERSSPADTFRFAPDPTAPLEDRVRYLEQNTPNAAFGAINSLFSGFPLGQKNAWVGRLNLSQTVFDGTVFAGVRAAREFEALARAQETQAEADLRLQITEAYYDAVLAQQLISITDSSAGQLDRQLNQIRLVRSAGNASDLDVLRVRVDRENLEPELVAAANQRDLSLLNLKRLINLSVETPVALTDSLSTAGFAPVSRQGVETLTEGALARRASIEVGRRQVALQQQQLRATKAAALPTLSVTAAIGEQSLPSGFLPSDFQDDWSVGFAVQVPIFSGFRRSSQVAQARGAAPAVGAAAGPASGAGGDGRRTAARRAEPRGRADRGAGPDHRAGRNGLPTGRPGLRQGRGDDARPPGRPAVVEQGQRQRSPGVNGTYYLALARLMRAAGAPISLTVALHTPHAVPPALDADVAGGERQP